MVWYTVEVMYFHTQVIQAHVFCFLAHLVQSHQFLLDSITFFYQVIEFDISVMIIIDKLEPILLVLFWNDIDALALAIHIFHLVSLQSGDAGNEILQFFLGILATIADGSG